MPDEDCFLCKGKGVVTRKADGKVVPCNFCSDGADAELVPPAPANIVPTTSMPVLVQGTGAKAASPAGAVHSYTYNGVGTIIREAMGVVVPGQVGFIDDIYQTTGDTLMECKAAFEEAVDDDQANGAAGPGQASPAKPANPIKTLNAAAQALAATLGLKAGAPASTVPPLPGCKVLKPIQEKTTIQKLMGKLGGHRKAGVGGDSQVMLAFTDVAGGVDVQVQFKPEPVPGEPLSPAQALAGELMNLLNAFVQQGGMRAVQLESLDADTAMALDSGLLTPEEIRDAQKRKLESAFAEMDV